MKKTIQILLIEDNPGDARLISELLIEVKLFNYQFSSSLTLEEGLMRIQKEKFDIVLLDLNLPDSLGQRTFESIYSKYPDIPTILVSGIEDEELSIKLIALGAQDFISKSDITSHIIERSISHSLERNKLQISLKESEERYRNLVENSLIGVFRTRTDGEILYVNNAIRSMLAFDSEDELKSFGAIMRYKYPSERDKMISTLKEKGSVNSFEATIITKAGQERIFLMNTVLIGDILDGTLIDISDRKRAEKTLNEHTIRLQALLELNQMTNYPFAKILDFVLDAGQRMTESDFSFVGMVDPEETELTIHRWSKGVMEQCKIDTGTLSFRVSETGLLCECIRTRQPVFINDYKNDHPSKKGIPIGHVPILRMLAVPVFDEEHIVSVLAIANKPEDYTIDDALGITALLNKMIEIKKQQEAKEALRESEEKYRMVANFNYDWEAWLAPDGKYRYVSPSCERITGHSAEEFMANPNLMVQITHPDDKSNFIEHSHIANIETQEQDLSIDFRIQTKKGDIRWISHSCTAVYGDGGQWLGRRVSNRDITDRIKAEELLRLSETQLQVTLESTSDGILAIDNKGKVIKYNKRFAELWHIPGVLLKNGDDQLLLEFVLRQLSDPEAFLNKVKQLYNSDVVDNDLLEFNDGRTFERDSYAMIMEGAIIGRVWSFRDITARKLAENLLREANETLECKVQERTLALTISKQLLDDTGKLARIGGWELELRNNKLTWTDMVYEIHEVDKDFKPDLESAINFYAPEAVPIITNAVQMCITEGTSWDLELPFITAKQNHLWVRAIGRAIWEDDIIVKLSGVFHDITEHKKADDELRKYRDHLEVLVKERTKELESQYALLNALINSPGDIIIFSLDDKYCYTTFNEKHRQEMKKIWNADIKAGINILDCMHIPELKVQAKVSIDRVLEGEVFSEIQHQPEANIYYEFSWNPIVFGKEIVGVTVFIKDITERRRAEIEVQFKNEELIKINAEKDKFFSIIAHDLRSPFSSFLGLTHVMAEDLPSLTMAEIQNIAVSMSKSATNLYRLIENLLQWSQIQKGAINFNPEVIQLGLVVEESIEMIQEFAKTKGIEITTDFTKGLTVFADNIILQTVIRNLISNAIKFTPNGGKVRLIAKTNLNKSIEISVKDNGIGMNEEMVTNLFKIDVNNNRPGTNGEPSTGLGLLLCKEFVEKHNGKIWATSGQYGTTEGKGSTISFTLPFSDNPNIKV